MKKRKLDIVYKESQDKIDQIDPKNAIKVSPQSIERTVYKKIKQNPYHSSNSLPTTPSTVSTCVTTASTCKTNNTTPLNYNQNLATSNLQLPPPLLRSYEQPMTYVMSNSNYQSAQGGNNTNIVSNVMDKIINLHPFNLKQSDRTFEYLLNSPGNLKLSPEDQRNSNVEKRSIEDMQRSSHQVLPENAFVSRAPNMNLTYQNNFVYPSTISYSKHLSEAKEGQSQGIDLSAKFPSSQQNYFVRKGTPQLTIPNTKNKVNFPKINNNQGDREESRHSISLHQPMLTNVMPYHANQQISSINITKEQKLSRLPNNYGHYATSNLANEGYLRRNFNVILPLSSDPHTSPLHFPTKQHLIQTQSLLHQNKILSTSSVADKDKVQVTPRKIEMKPLVSSLSPPMRHQYLKPPFFQQLVHLSSKDGERCQGVQLYSPSSIQKHPSQSIALKTSVTSQLPETEEKNLYNCSSSTSSLNVKKRLEAPPVSTSKGNITGKRKYANRSSKISKDQSLSSSLISTKTSHSGGDDSLFSINNSTKLGNTLTQKKCENSSRTAHSNAKSKAIVIAEKISYTPASQLVAELDVNKANRTFWTERGIHSSLHTDSLSKYLTNNSSTKSLDFTSLEKQYEALALLIPSKYLKKIIPQVHNLLTNDIKHTKEKIECLQVLLPSLDIPKLLNDSPSLLIFNLKTTITEKVRLLKTLFAGVNTEKIIKHAPNILSYDIKDSIAPKIKKLESLLNLGTKDVIRLISHAPTVLYHDVKTSLAPKFKALSEMLPRANIGLVLQKAPPLLCSDITGSITQKFNKMLATIEDLHGAKDEFRDKVAQNPRILTCGYGVVYGRLDYYSDQNAKKIPLDEMRTLLLTKVTKLNETDPQYSTFLREKITSLHAELEGFKHDELQDEIDACRRKTEDTAANKGKKTLSKEVGMNEEKSHTLDIKTLDMKGLEEKYGTLLRKKFAQIERGIEKSPKK